MNAIRSGALQPEAAEPLALQSRSEWSRAMGSLRRARLAMVGLGVLAIVLIAAILAPQLASHDPNDVAPANRLKPPGLFGGDPSFPLGTDGLGRDILSRTLFGARVSLAVGFIAVFISGVIGVALGL